jgi:hypothetical protein
LSKNIPDEQILGQTRRVRVLSDDSSKTAFGETLVGQLHPIFYGSFEYTVDNTTQNINTVQGSGTVGQSQAMAVVGTGTTIGSTALLQSKQHAKYHAGLGGMARFTGLFSEPVVGTEQFIGILGETSSNGTTFSDGFSVGYDGTEFGFYRFQDNTIKSVPQNEWNLDRMDGTGPSGMVLDHQKLNVYFIQFQYLGAGAISLHIEDEFTGEMVKVHNLLYANLNTIPSVFNPNFHFTMFCRNKLTTSNVECKSASYAYFIEGKTDYTEIHQPHFATGIQQKLTVTSEVAIVTLRNKLKYAGKSNFIDILIQGLTGSVESSAANNLANLRLIRNTTLGGAPSYSDINTTDSVIEMDTSGTTVTGGQELISVPLAGKNDKESRDITGLRIVLNPGDTLTISGSSENSSTLRAGILWKELI